MRRLLIVLALACSGLAVEAGPIRVPRRPPVRRPRIRRRRHSRKVRRPPTWRARKPVPPPRKGPRKLRPRSRARKKAGMPLDSPRSPR